MKYGCIEYLSILPETPKGLPDPCSCNVKKCKATKAAKMKGNR